IEHGYQLPDSLCALMAVKGVYFVPTDISADEFTQMEEMTKEEALAILKKYSHERLQSAIKHKVKIVSGSDNYIDFNIPQGEAAKRVLIAYLEAGMTPVQILTAATKTAAEF